MILSYLTPRFSGQLKPNKISANFIKVLGLQLRSSGLFPYTSSWRNKYDILNQSEIQISFRSNSFFTHINIGLNDITITLDLKDNSIHYTVAFWKWTLFCISMGLCLGMVMLFGHHLLPTNGYPPDYLKHDYYWPFVCFWSLIWPWIMIPIHKIPAKKCLEQILRNIHTLSITQS